MTIKDFKEASLQRAKATPTGAGQVNVLKNGTASRPGGNLSDPRWHRRRRTSTTEAHNQRKITPAQSERQRKNQKSIREEINIITLKIVFSDNTTCQTETVQETKKAAKHNNDKDYASQTDFNKPTSTTQIESANQEIHSQTKLSIMVHKISSIE